MGKCGNKKGVGGVEGIKMDNQRSVVGLMGIKVFLVLLEETLFCIHTLHSLTFFFIIIFISLQITLGGWGFTRQDWYNVTVDFILLNPLKFQINVIAIVYQYKPLILEWRIG